MTWPLGLLVLAALAAWLVEARRRTRHPVPPGCQRDISLPHTQAFELYHNALSLCSMKTRVCLAELGIPYRSHPIDLIETGAYENIRAPFLRVNPGTRCRCSSTRATRSTSRTSRSATPPATRPPGARR